MNVSLQHDVMAEDMKEVLLKPLLKKASLDYEIFKNYRPVSNLMFISKSCGKVVASQLNHHLHNNNLEELFQSAYKAGHSTESALIRVQNDVLCAIDDVSFCCYWIFQQLLTRLTITYFCQDCLTASGSRGRCIHGSSHIFVVEGSLCALGTQDLVSTSSYGI